MLEVYRRVIETIELKKIYEIYSKCEDLETEMERRHKKI
jgi:hypothetical protein